MIEFVHRCYKRGGVVWEYGVLTLRLIHSDVDGQWRLIFEGYCDNLIRCKWVWSI